MKIIIFLLFGISMLFAEVAKVSTIVGDAKIQRGSKSLKIINGSLIEKDDVIITSRNSKLQLIFKDNTVITVGKNSKLDINEYIFDEQIPKNSQTNFNLLKGTFKVITGKIGKINKEKFKLKVKSSTIGIRGTNFIVRLEKKGFNVTVTDGGVYVTHPDAPEQKVFVDKNQTAKVVDGKIEVKEITIEEKETEELALEPENEDDSTTSESGESTQDESSSSETDNESSEGKTEDNQEESSSSETSSDSTETQSEETESSSTTTQSSETSYTDSSIEESSDDDTSSSSTVSDSSTTSSDTTTSSTETTQTASQASTDSTANKDLVVTYTLNGHLLGGYDDGSTTALRSFLRTDKDTSDSVFTATRVKEKLAYDDKILKKYEQTSSANKTVTHIGNNTYSGTYGSSSYTGNMSIGTIPITYYYENVGGTETSVTTNYSVQADNLGEFFIAYVDDTSFKELFVVGTDSSLSTFDSSKIYAYDTYADIKISKDSTDKITSIAVTTDDNGTEYYNPLYNSLTHINKYFYSRGAEEFIYGNSTKVKTYRNKYTFTYGAVSSVTTNLTKVETGTTNADISFKGSKVQGLMYSLTSDNTTKDYSSSPTTTVTTSTQSLGGSFLDSNDSVNTDNSTETLDYSGFLVAEIYGTNHQRESNNNLSFKIEKNSSDKTVKISGSGSVYDSTNTNGVDLAFEGNLSSDNAYFINDDLFGVLAKSGDTEYKTSTNTYSMVSNTGYLIAVPDGGYDSNDNAVMLDDESSWGYWTAKFDDGSGNSITFVDTTSTWVAGVQTAASVVDSTMLNVNGTYEYKGHVLGNVLTSAGNLENIIYGKYNNTSYTNEVNLKFNIGNTNSLSGTMGFYSTNTTTTPTQWDITLTGSTITNTKFDGTISGSGSNGSFEGKYYGTSSVKSVGGTFKATSSNNDVAQGVFKAVKQ